MPYCNSLPNITRPADVPKFVPVMVNCSLATAVVGLRLVMDGYTTVRLSELLCT